MTNEQVDALLESYRESKARLAFLEQETEELKAAILTQERQTASEEALRAQQYDGMPPSGVVTQAVQDAAIRYADGYQSPMLRSWRQQLADMEQELAALRRKVRIVDNWLGALTPRESLILQLHKPIGDLSWRELADRSPELLGFWMSQSGLRKIGDGARDKIYRIAR